MTKAAVYARVSSDEQEEKGTIEGQIQYANKYMELHGPESNITDYEMYLDDGISGIIPLAERPAGARLIADAKASKYQALYVYRLDRLARSVRHVLDTYEILQSRGIALRSMTEAFDTNTPTGKFFMTLLASIAALERDTIMERTSMGKDRGAKEGRWVTGAPPFGYRIGENRKLEIYEPEAETARLIFKLYLENMSTIEIAKYLNAREIPTPAKSKGTRNNSTGKWHAGHISIILRTEAYSGKYTYLKRSKRDKETIPVEVPVIISGSDYSTVDKKLVENADAARGSRGRSYLLRGLIFCGECGRAMVGSSGSSKGGRVYYRCSGTVNTGAGKKCTAKLIRATSIEDSVWQDIRDFFKHPDKVKEVLDEQIKNSMEELEPANKELDLVEEDILEKREARGKTISMCARGIISDQEAETELKALAAEIESLTARRDFLFDHQTTIQKLETEVLNAQVMLERLGQEGIEEFTEAERTELIRGMVRRVDIYTIINNGKKDSRAEIQYLFDGFPRCMALGISAYSQNHTTDKNLIIETIWKFQSFSRNGGERVAAR